MFAKTVLIRASISVILSLPWCASSTATASEWLIAPFALYEKANEKILVDGVSTTYALGVAGGQITYKDSNNYHITAQAGFGQSNNQDVSFSGAQFNGKVSGIFFGASATKKLLIYKNTAFFVEGSYSKRNLKAESLVGYRNSLALTGNSTSTITSRDFIIHLNQEISDKINISAAIGYGVWNMDADATAYFSSGNIRANANKRIDTTGRDPIFKVGIGYLNRKSEIRFNLSKRSLRSQTDTGIMSAEVIASFNF